MAPKGMKRAAAKPPAEEPKAKRVSAFLKQQGVSKANIQPIIDVIEHPLADLSEDARGMLLATLPWSLAVPCELRHKVQQGVVDMVNSVVKVVHDQLQKQVASEVGQVEELEGSRSTLLGNIEKAEFAVAETGKVVQECKERLSEVEAATGAKEVVVNEIELEVQRMAIELEGVRSLAGQFEEVLSGSFVTLRELSFEDSDVESLVENVMAMVNQCNMVESLTVSVGPCLMKRERGSFDLLCIGQAEQGLRGKAYALAAEIEQSEEQLSACKTTAQAACAELDAAKATQIQAVDELHTAQETNEGALQKVVEAKAVVTDFEASMVEATSKLDVKRNELETFCTYQVFMCNLLRDQTGNKPSAEASAEPIAHLMGETTAEHVADANDVVAKLLPEESVARVPEQESTDVTASLAGVAA